MTPSDDCRDGQAQHRGDGTAARPCPPRAASARGGDRTGRRASARRPAAAARPLAPPAEQERQGLRRRRLDPVGHTTYAAQQHATR